MQGVVQETLLPAVAASRSAGYDVARDASTDVAVWIATNACSRSDQRRPRQNQAGRPVPGRLRGEADSLIYEPAARYALREGMELALLAAIQVLPGRQRAVLIMRDVV